MSVEFCVLVGLPATSRGGKDQVAGEPIPTGGRPQRARLPLHLCPRSTLSASPSIRAPFQSCVLHLLPGSSCSCRSSAPSTVRLGCTAARMLVPLVLDPRRHSATDAVKIRVGPKGVETKGVKHSMVCLQDADPRLYRIRLMSFLDASRTPLTRSVGFAHFGLAAPTLTCWCSDSRRGSRQAARKGQRGDRKDHGGQHRSGKGFRGPAHGTGHGRR